MDTTLTQTPQLNIVTDRAHPASILPEGSSLPQQDNASSHTAKTTQEWLKEHDKVPQGINPGIKTPQIPIWLRFCRMCRNKPNPRPYSTTRRAQKIHCQHPGGPHHRTPTEVSFPFPDGSELFRWQRGALHNIRQVVSMFWLVGFICFLERLLLRAACGNYMLLFICILHF